MQPVEKDANVADVVIDGCDTDWFSIIAAAVRIVLFLGKIVDIESVLSTHHQVINVAADDILRDLIHSVNLQFVRQPTPEKMEGLLIAAHGFFTQLGTTAINHKFIDLPIKIQTNHDKTPLIFIGLKYPIDQECW